MSKKKMQALRARLMAAETLRDHYKSAYENLSKRNADLHVWLGEKMKKTCNTCEIQNICQYAPGWGEPVRWNCPHFVPCERGDAK